MDCFHFRIDFGAILKPFMEELRLSGTNRASNAGTGSSNVPVESVQSRLEPELQEYSLVDAGVEDSRVYCSCCIGPNGSYNQNSEGDLFHVASPRVDPLHTSYPTAFFNSLTPSEMRCLATSKTGFSYFQLMLSKNDPNIRKKIVKVVAENLFYLMQDPYGNKLFHHIIETPNIDELQLFFAEMASQPESLIRVSKTDYGSSSVMKLIQDFRQSPLIRLLTSALAKGVYTLMTNQRGRGVIYKCFSLIDSHKREKLSEAVAQHCIRLSREETGCRCLTECMEFITGAPREGLLYAISDNSLFLAEDFIGNYVLQHVLNLQNPRINNIICSRLYGKYVYLSFTKIGSHVVQKCLGTSGVAYVIDELLKSNKILDLARNQFGNYVVKTALSVTQVKDPASHRIILFLLKQQIRSLRQHPFGKNVYKLIMEQHKFPAALE